MRLSHSRKALLAAMALALASGGTRLLAHGDVTPQQVDTSALPEIGNDWLKHNPYRGNAKALEIGKTAYGENCARCHGLDALSGGIAPDLRYLELGDSGDEWFIMRYQHGSSRDGKVYMPPLGEILGQKTGWAIRTWLESRHTDD
ncbi:MAG TPA: cytochrome c-550 PedF [Novosphingobium sp.]|nr:cytochrome c-550 PedF [Novosphingobium sp.]